MCDEWRYDFMKFYQWSMDNGYKDELSLNRIDNENGNYEPINCNWADTPEQNQNRRMSKNNKSGYRCVSWNKIKQKWVCNITSNHTHHHIGYFDDKKDAAKAYNEWVAKNKTFHQLNIITN